MSSAAMLATTAGEKHAENAAPLLSGPAAPGEPAHERANAAQQQATAELRTEKGLQEAMETAKSTFGFRRLEGPLRFGLSPQPFTDDEQNDLGRKRSNRIGYLEGLRGLLALEVMLWSFFRIMAPAIATDTDIDGTRPAVFVNAAPMWMNSLRKALQPLFWDGHLQYTFSFILSGRVLAETFIERRSALSLAGAAFRRPLRLLPSVTLALAIASIVAAAKGFSNAAQFSQDTQNSFAAPPTVWSSTIQYFNALVGLFFSRDAIDRGVLFFPPRGILWFVPQVFTQSYTVYTISYLLPFTRTKWKFIGLFVFLLLAWWVGSWSWYTVTGLTLAELAVAYDLAELSKHAIPIPMPKRLLKSGRMHIPSWAPPALLLALGTTFKYLWEDKFPQDRDDNIVWHANQSTGGFNTGFNLSEQHYPRLDDWFFAAGAMFLIEMSSKVRRVLDNPVFRQLGRLSFPLYLLSGIIFLSLGTLIHNHLVHSQGWTNEANVLAAVFFAVVPVALVSAEIFQRIVEEPSFISARFGFNWLRAE